MALRTLSLCTGYGGLELGLRAAGVPVRVVGAVERQAYAAAVLAHRMVDGALDPCPIWDDLESFDGGAYRDRVDLVVAGFPCQGASVAGKRLGTADARWLWPTVWRTVIACNASMLFIENVPGLLTVNNGRAFGEIIDALAARGWVAEWDCVSAGSVGAPHVRDRIFLLAADPSRLGLQATVARDERQPWKDRVSHGGTCGHGVLVGIPEPASHGVDDGSPAAMERVHLLGNGVVPQAAARAWAILAERLRDSV